MATSVTSSFAGKATDFYLSALIEGKTLSTAGITIDNDVQFKYVVRGFDMANIVQTGDSCSWSDGGSTTVTEGIKEVQPFFVNKTECIKDWKANWIGVSKDDLPAEVLSKLEQKTKDIIKAKTETDLWRSSTTSATVSGNSYTVNLYDGYLKLLKAGSAVSVGGTVLTKANIVTELDKVLLGLPDAIKSIAGQDPSKVVIFVSFKAEQLLKSALSTQGQNTSDKNYTAYHQGIEVRGVGIFDNVIACGLRESFHCASNIGLDEAKIDFINMGIVGEKNVRIAADWKYVPAVSNASQIVLYNF